MIYFNSSYSSLISIWFRRVPTKRVLVFFSNMIRMYIEIVLQSENLFGYTNWSKASQHLLYMINITSSISGSHLLHSVEFVHNPHDSQLYTFRRKAWQEVSVLDWNADRDNAKVTRRFYFQSLRGRNWVHLGHSVLLPWIQTLLS